MPLLVAAVAGLGLAFKHEPQLNHFVVRVLLDCVLTVLQLPFAIARLPLLLASGAAPTEPPE